MRATRTPTTCRSRGATISCARIGGHGIFIETALCQARRGKALGDTGFGSFVLRGARRNSSGGARGDALRRVRRPDARPLGVKVAKRLDAGTWVVHTNAATCSHARRAIEAVRWLTAHKRSCVVAPRGDACRLHRGWGSAGRASSDGNK